MKLDRDFKSSKNDETEAPRAAALTNRELGWGSKANGEFKNIDDLTKVKGIGDKKLLKLKPYLKKIS